MAQHFQPWPDEEDFFAQSHLASRTFLPQHGAWADSRGDGRDGICLRLNQIPFPVVPTSSPTHWLPKRVEHESM